MVFKESVLDRFPEMQITSRYYTVGHRLRDKVMQTYAVDYVKNVS